MHYAAKTGSIEIVELLVQTGANVNIMDEQEDTALDLAVRKHNQFLSEYLRSVGAVSRRMSYPEIWK